jgi:DNA invertase Pin-like site-specific DNA recombinase
MTVRVYVRVSTAEQRCELQVRELREYAESQRWQIADIYEDLSSGAKASRATLNRLIADSRARKFDCLLVWKLDRFGRSLVDCLNNIKIVEEKGIQFISVTQGWIRISRIRRRGFCCTCWVPRRSSSGH